MLVNLKRVFSFALTDFYRNKGMSVAAIFVLVITTLLVTGLFFSHGISNFLISTINNKIDITAYFKTDAAEQDIKNVRDKLLKESFDIKTIEYISKDDALQNFTQKHQDNSTFSKALSEVGDNPFLPSLNITTNGKAASYQQIANILQNSQFNNIIEKVDFSQKKDTIEKVMSITSAINDFGLALGSILILIAILVVFNTIKLVIESSKEEIGTMKIVGASSWFVRAPFIIEGALFGIISFIICFLATMLAVYFLSSPVSVVMPGFNLFNYFMLNFWMVILIQLAFGIGLGVVASFMGVRKYLKV